METQTIKCKHLEVHNYCHTNQCGGSSVFRRFFKPKCNFTILWSAFKKKVRKSDRIRVRFRVRVRVRLGLEKEYG